MVSADMISQPEHRHEKSRWESVSSRIDFIVPLKSDSESQTEALHSIKQVKVAIKREQQLTKDLEEEAVYLEQRSSFSDKKGSGSSKRAKLEIESRLETMKREIRSRKFSLAVARAAFAEFMLAGDDEIIDLSGVVRHARDEYLFDTDITVSDGRLKEIVESMLDKLGLYVKEANSWNLNLGFSVHQEILV
jgi:hypothetical protein